MMQTDEMLALLRKEYTVLEGYNITVVRRFTSAGDRIYNCFLVETDKPGFERFVAKGFVRDPLTLQREWLVLRLLQPHGVPAPRLLVPNHTPKHFLLMSYIEGEPASKKIATLRRTEQAVLFAKMGEEVGRIHSLPVATYGNLLAPSLVTWEEYVKTSLSQKQAAVKDIVEGVLLRHAKQIATELYPVLHTESHHAPRLIHHDIYLENFLISDDLSTVTLIDYGIAYGGRPLFDLAKFYIWDLVRYPVYKANFMTTYEAYIPLPTYFSDIMRFYLLFECFGMIAYFHKIGADEELRQSIQTLTDVVYGRGRVMELLL